MSEEEIIEIIKDFLDLREIHSSDAMTKSFLSIYKEAIQGLLDLYNKEKEKNKELTDEYLIQRNLINAEFLNENYISKDKIKAKIEECEKEKNIPHEMDFKAFYRIKDLKNIEIKVLQSLLDKE